MKATLEHGLLKPLDKCVIEIPTPPTVTTTPARLDPKLIERHGEEGIARLVELGKLTLPKPTTVTTLNKATAIVLRILPEISDKKSASYRDEPVMGRSFPIKTYSHSENRTITMRVHFIALGDGDIRQNLSNLRALQSAVYPYSNDQANPYLPPPICRIKCGELFTSANEGFICVILRDYSVDFPTDVIWDDETYLPYKFDVNLSWDVVFSSSSLPGSEMIIGDWV